MHVLSTHASIRAAERLCSAAQDGWNELCERLLITRDREDRDARIFENILELCYLKLNRLAFQPSGTSYRRHADQVGVYLGLVRRFRREGVGGISHGVMDTLAWQSCRRD